MKNSKTIDCLSSYEVGFLNRITASVNPINSDESLSLQQHFIKTRSIMAEIKGKTYELNEVPINEITGLSNKNYFVSKQFILNNQARIAVLHDPNILGNQEIAGLSESDIVYGSLHAAGLEIPYQSIEQSLNLTGHVGNVARNYLPGSLLRPEDIGNRIQNIPNIQSQISIGHIGINSLEELSYEASLMFSERLSASCVLDLYNLVSLSDTQETFCLLVHGHRIASVIGIPLFLRLLPYLAEPGRFWMFLNNTSRLLSLKVGNKIDYLKQSFTVRFYSFYTNMNLRSIISHINRVYPGLIALPAEQLAQEFSSSVPICEALEGEMVVGDDVGVIPVEEFETALAQEVHLNNNENNSPPVVLVDLQPEILPNANISFASINAAGDLGEEYENFQNFQNFHFDDEEDENL